jgi:hypothetical protein
MAIAMELGFKEIKLIEYALTRIIDVEELAERKTQLKTLHAKIQDTITTEENMRWDKEKIQQESPEL